jgi:hypothetical protein
MELSDETLSAVTSLLSGERLGTFLALAGSPRSAVALHQRTPQLAGSLMSVIAVVEIALRNTICDHLATHLGSGDWLRNPSAPFIWRDQEKTRIGEAIASAQRGRICKAGPRAEARDRRPVVP